MQWHFLDRAQAGEKLAAALKSYRDQPAVIFGIPRGGVVVAFSVAKALRKPLDIIAPRKIPIPWEPEAGFGAICADGTIIINQPLVKRLGLSEREIEQEVHVVQQEVIRRTLAYRGDQPVPDLSGKTAIVVDDGLATGYTMIAALMSLKKSGAKELVAAVPVSPRDSLEQVKPHCDKIVCLMVSDMRPFAVAMYYENFPELHDEEVIQLLARAKEWVPKEAEK